MTDCSRCKNKFSEYLDAALSPRDRELLEAHLAACDICADDFAGLVAAHQALASLAEPIKPSPVLSAVRARIRQQEKAPSSMWWRWAAAPALAGALALAYFMSNAPAPDRQVALAPEGQPKISVTVPDNPIPPAVVATKPEAQPKPAAALTRPKSAVVRTQATIRPVRMAAVPAAARPEATPKPAPDVASERAPEAASGPRILVAAYRPAESYSGQAFDSDSGRRVARWSVKRSYSASGSVDQAEVVLHFAPTVPADNENDSNTRPNERSESDHYMVDLIGRV